MLVRCAWIHEVSAEELLEGWVVRRYPLPETPYEFAEWKKVRVNLDYHVELGDHYYSVPYPRLVHQAVELRFTQTCVEALHDGKRIAIHQRKLSSQSRFTTLVEHMPAASRGPGHAVAGEDPAVGAQHVGQDDRGTVRAHHRRQNHSPAGLTACAMRDSHRLSKRFGNRRLVEAGSDAKDCGRGRVSITR